MKGTPRNKYVLTPEHQAQLEPWRDRWIQNALSTQALTPDDPERIRSAVRGLYTAANLPPPPDHRIVIVPSPTVARFAGGFATAIWFLRHVAPQAATGVATGAATWTAPEAATRAAMWAVTREATGVATGAATEVATRTATRAATEEAIEVATRAATWAATGEATGAAIEAATWAATREATRAVTEVATRAATRAAMWAAPGAAIGAATEAATRAASRGTTQAVTTGATEAATEAAAWAAMWAATAVATAMATEAATEAATPTTQATLAAAIEAATRAATQQVGDTATTGPALHETWYHIPTDLFGALARTIFGDETAAIFALRCAREVYQSMWDGGNQWSGWVAYLAFFRHVVKLPLDYTRWSPYEILAEYGPRVVHPDFCLVSERPTGLRVDANNRPHNETGPFCEWRDGTALYAVHGVLVPAWLIEEPERLTVAHIQQESNTEVRRIMIERFGFDRFITEIGALPTQADAYGTLYRCEFPNDEPLVMVRVINATPESGPALGLREQQGAWYKTYTLRVPPTVTTAREAVAWSFGLSADDYVPDWAT